MNETSDSRLQTISLDGTPPRSVIADAASAHAIKRHMIRADIGRSAQRAIIKNMYDGHPPQDQAELLKRGIGDMSNTNMKRMAAAVNTLTDSDLDAQFETNPLFSVVTEWGNKGPQWSEGITEEFNRSMDRWAEYYSVRAKSSFNRNFYGYGPTYFEDCYNWRVIAADTGQVYFDKDADVNLDNNDVVMFRKTWRLHELYRKIEDPVVAEKMGWDVEATRKAIYIAATSKDTSADAYSSRLWETWSNKIKGNDLYWSSVAPGIVLYDLLAVEYDGTVSRRLLTEDDTDAILHTSYKAGKSIRETLCPFFISRQESLVHCIRGYGANIYGVLKMLDKIDNRIFDMTLIAGSIVIQPKTSGARDQLNALNLGPVTVIPSEVNFVQTQFPSNSQNGIVTHNMLMQAMSQVSGEYQSATQSTQTGEAPTATQNNNDVAMLARRSSSQRNQLFMELDNEGWQMFKRISNPNLPDKCTKAGKSEWCQEARLFQKRILDRGIPLSALQEPYLQSVKATRPIGAGSAIARVQQAHELIGMMPLVQNAQAKELMLKDAFTAIFGPALTKRYFPAIPGIQLQSTAKTAQIENNQFQDGHSLEVMDNEDAVTHLAIHLPLLMSAAQSVETQPDAPAQEGQPQNMDIKGKVYALLSIALPHCSAHLQRIAGDPTMKKEVDMIVNVMRKLGATANHLQFELKAAASQQQRAAVSQAQQQTTDAAKLQLDAQKLQLAQRKQGHKEQIDNVNTQLKVAKAQQDLHLNDLDASLRVREFAKPEPTANAPA